MVSGLYPVEVDNYDLPKDSLQKLALNDASFTYETETSGARFGFRCGFRPSFGNCPRKAEQRV